jgi:GAF domain-containing protein
MSPPTRASTALLAVPVTDESGTVGVLEALDRRGGTFSMRDLDLATSIAGLAAGAARLGRVRGDATVVLADSIAALLAVPEGAAPDAATVESLVSRATAGLERDDDPTWALADRLARLRDVDPDAIELAIEWLDALLRHRPGRIP